MGIVSQEPVLFATTIGENIRLGAKWGDEVTQEQIEMAAKQANCYDFISKLPKVSSLLVYTICNLYRLVKILRLW